MNEALPQTLDLKWTHVKESLGFSVNHMVCKEGGGGTWDVCGLEKKMDARRLLGPHWKAQGQVWCHRQNQESRGLSKVCESRRSGYNYIIYLFFVWLVLCKSLSV